MAKGFKWLLGVLALLLAIALSPLLFLLLLIPVYFAFDYRTGSEPRLSLRWLFLHWRYTRDQMERAEKKFISGVKKPVSDSINKKEGALTFSDFKGMGAALLSAIPKPFRMLLRGLRFTRVELDLLVAEEDAARTAIAYGETNAAVYAVYALARESLNMAEPVIRIRPSFTAEKGEVRAHFRARLTPLVAAAAFARFGFGFLGKLLRNKSREAAAETRPPDRTASHSGAQAEK